MTCYHPISACYSKSYYAKTGKKQINLVLTETPGVKDEKWLCNEKNFPHSLYEYVQLPCRKCVGCRSDNAKMWSVRAYNELKMNKFNCFITLTYDDNSLLVEKDPLCVVSLRYKHFQNFMKKLRKEFPNDNIQYLVCGEYGPNSGRSHFHAILFGFDFPDKTLVYRSKGYNHYASETLSRLWSTYDRNSDNYVPNGYVDLADVDYDCCAYVSQYVLKKLPDIDCKHPVMSQYIDENGDFKDVILEDRCPPFVHSSRRPAIGKKYFDKYGTRDVELGYVGFATKGKSKRIKTPEYYYKKFEEINPERFAELKEEKEKKMKRYYKDNPVDRPKLELWEKSHMYRINQKLKKFLTKLFN